MTNPQWPIYASPDQAESAQIESGIIRRSVVGSGCIVNGAVLDHTMLRRSVIVETGAYLDQCIVMERSVVGRGARLRRVIVDQDNDIPARETIGFDPARDRQRFYISEGGVVVVPRAFFKSSSERERAGARGRSGREAERLRILFVTSECAPGRRPAGSATSAPRCLRRSARSATTCAS